MSFRRAWRICWWCVGHGSRLLLWSIWIVLLLLLAGQVYLLSSHRIILPETVRLRVAERLSEHGLRLGYDRGLVDLAGHIILENVRFGPDSDNSPYATARSVYARIDPWELIVGHVNPTDVRVDGLALHLPASLSPTAVDEVLAERIDFALRPRGKEIELSYLTGRVGRLAIEADGRLPLPAGGTGRGDPLAGVWPEIARCSQLLDRWLEALESPVLHLRVENGLVEIEAEATSLNLAAVPGGRSGLLSGLRARTALPLRFTPDTPVNVTGTVEKLNLPEGVTARGLTFRLATDAAFRSPAVQLQLGSARWRKIETGPLALTAARSPAGTLTADVSLGLAGGVWRVQGNLGDDGSATASLDGVVGDATLAFAGGLIDRDLPALLDPDQSAPLHARASFGPGWKLIEASGRLHSGSVRVGKTRLDETGAEFTYDGARVLANHLVLRQGESLAHGSYEMNTRTMDFRFLLTGGLRPLGISGWFLEWWPDFWQNFDFSQSLPTADVDVQGRWGDPAATNVFVQAEGARTGLKGVDFDRVQTRLYLRPQWFDILHFGVNRDGHAAQGRLSRTIDLAKNTWTRMDFAVDSTLPLTTISQLFPGESSAALAPYDFGSPPALRLGGHVTSAASPEGKHESIDIELTSAGPMTYHRFPLADLAFQARLRDDLIDLPSLSATFAGGQATGDANLWTTPQGRRLAFNITLDGANLGAVVQTVSALQPPAKPLTEKETEAIRLRQQRLENGRLDFKLKAEGLFDDPCSFNGEGLGSITNAELGQLNLFGPLSELLSGTFLNLGSFSLTTVQAPFKLNGERVHFGDLRISGPSALILAKGSYLLRGGDLDFTAKIHPFDESTSLFGSAASLVFTPFSKVFEVKLKGTLSKPSWVFAYGPSRLLNTLTGKSGTPAASAPTPKNRSPETDG